MVRTIPGKMTRRKPVDANASSTGFIGYFFLPLELPPEDLPPPDGPPPPPFGGVEGRCGDERALFLLAIRTSWHRMVRFRDAFSQRCSCEGRDQRRPNV